MRATAKKDGPITGQKLDRERNEKGQFVKGHRGSGGRPKLPEELREAFQKVCPEALEVLVAIMSDADAKDTDRIRAAEVILERGYGKPVQAVDLDAESKVVIKLSHEALKNGE